MISKKEWLIVAIICLVTVLIVLSPYLYGYFTTPENKIFTGVTFDHDYSYYSMIQQAREGSLLFQNYYTHEEHRSIFFRPLFLIIGFFANIFNTSNAFAFHFFKIIFIIGLIFLSYRFISIFFKEKAHRLICLIILTFSSGFGFIAGRLNYLSTDLWVPESQVFSSFFSQPHFILSQILILLCFIWLLKKDLKYAVFAGLANLLLGFIHPFDLVTTILIPSVYFIILYFWKKDNRILNLIIYGAITIPAVIYQYLALQIEPIAKSWNDQNILESPEIFSWIIGYGAIFILAIVGFFQFFRTKNKNLLFINIWAVLNLGLLYIPVNFQRRLSEGLHFPLCILAMFGILIIYNYLGKYIQKKKIYTYIPQIIFVWIVILALPFSNINRLANYFVNYNEKKELPYYFDKSMYNTLDWFNQNNKKNKIILTSRKLGPFVPGITNNRVYLGFVFQTKDYAFKTKKTEWFFKKNDQDKGKRIFLEKNNINYILFGPEERELGKFQPENKKYLEKVYEDNDYTLYKVKYIDL